ncbi:hypothetical protein PENSPDRAFT_749505 [Peniophora sp. CONT]|nr:hypothetical protein PENSPDRAFT_749505 [Peniophora sp. CONT]
MESQGNTSVAMDWTGWRSVFHLQHVVCGLYLWEWVTTLGYEFRFYIGRRSCTWTFWLYLLCRYSALGAILNLLLELNDTHKLDCLIWARLMILLPYLGVLMASLLIAVRAIAIWNRHRTVVALSLMGVLTSFALLIHSMVIVSASWSDEYRTCALPDSAPTGLPVLAATLAFDVLMLLLMLIGLFRKRVARRCTVWDFLLKQGLLWLALATAAEVPTVIIIALDFRDALNQTFQTVGVVMIVLAATKMYRSLTNVLLASRESPPQCTDNVRLEVLQCCVSRSLYTSCPADTAATRPVEIEVRMEQEVA